MPELPWKTNSGAPAPSATAVPGDGAGPPSDTASAACPQLALADPGFENGGTGWTSGAGTGVGTGNSHGGARFLYLDSGPGKSARRVLEQQAAVGPQFFERGALMGEQDGHFRLFLKVVLRCRRLPGGVVPVVPAVSRSSGSRRHRRCVRARRRWCG
ncbi:hypothetical protein [Streptomyces sp. NPDC058466]|uniref:hypothetical protein n=1 Tax=Streptomyces sp. NPDC058466 TaxID=3346512 RepID=UPI00364AF075